MTDQFTGNTVKSTPPFTVGSEWKITWNTSPADSGAANFKVYIYDTEGNVVGVAADVTGANAGESYQHEAGTYHLLINTAQPYTVGIWEKR